MATTEVFYDGDGSDVTFTIPFEYLEESDVKVSVGGTLKTQDTDYTFSELTEITFTTAPASGTKNVRIFRDTDIDSGVRNEFFAGSAIRAQDLNDDFLQVLYSAQEIEDQFVTKTDGEFDTNVDMNDNRITEMADPVNAKDAVNKQYFEANSWDDETETLHSDETWSSVDTQIATAKAIENRIAAKIDTALETDVLVDNSGLNKTGNGGQVTLGITANSVDLDRIKNSDIINNAEQDAQSPAPSDNNIFTALAAKTRHDALVQTGTPAGSTFQTGKLWYQNDSDQTLHMWDGSKWDGVTSGGTFTKLEKVIYVDSVNGNDNNEGHRISSPKASIKAAVEAINSDSTFGDGSVVLVAPGIYQEAAPIDIEKRDVAIIGASVRNVIVHPTSATETNSLFRVNSGTYLHNMTFTGMKASGTRGDTGSLWEDATHGLPPTQGWNVSFFPNAMIFKSPYVQNCTNFSDSEIDNDNLNFYAGDEDKGRAGDLDHAPTGGGLLVDGSVPHADSPLRSIVCDSYTHTGLDAPGIFVTNNGYMQATSSYAFFNHFHIACINGGQANLAASTSDFGRFSLIADGKSTTDIFDGLVKGTPSSGDTTFTVDNVAANSGWHGSSVRPASNMLVEVGGNLYPILSSTVVSDTEFTVTISRPDTNDRTQNLGLSNSPADNSAVKFFLRSMIASSGHTMEYVGAGVDYRALPEYAAGTYELGSGTSPNGVHQESHQKKELNDGKVWAAITDHNGKFRVGDTFSVDQQSGFVSIPAGALSVNTLLEDLNVNGKEIKSVTTNQNIVLNPNGTGTVDVSSSRITSVSDPTGAQDAATKDYVDNFTGGSSNIGSGAVTNAKIADGAVTSAKMSGATVVTNSEHASATTNDTSFFTTSASDARYFRQDSSETITSGVSWSSDDSNVATTAAIDARVIDLVDDVGGFVPITNETSFPTANPDVNNGAGTLVSIKEIGTSRTPSSGTVTIANGSGSNTVTINNCGTTVLAAGFGAIVETTSTLHTYNFHRLTPKATEVTTVAGISSNVTTVAGIDSDVTTVAGISSDVTTVAGIDSDVTAVAGKATEIGRLGTADAVADLNTLGTADVVADLNTLGTADVVSDMNTLATSSNVTAMSNCSDDISNINTVAGSISNVNTTAGSISNVNTVASNINSVNDFADKYRIGANDPTTNNDTGDLFYNTTSNTLKIFDGSSYQTGVTDTAGFVTTSGATMAGDIAMGGNDITGLGAPTNDNDAARKVYVDDTIDSKIDTALTSDIVGGTGITVSDDSPGSGQITIAVTAGSIGATQLASTAVTAGSYGSSTAIPSITVDADGRITAASTNSITQVGGSNGVDFNDSVKARFGTGNDLEIFHDGTNSRIHDTGTGGLILQGDAQINLQSASNENYIECVSNGAVTVYHNNDAKLATKSDGVLVTGELQATTLDINGAADISSHLTLHGNLDLQDNDEIRVGAGDDLKIYHDGSNSFINETGTGGLIVKSGDIYLRNPSDGDMVHAQSGGYVKLYHNGNEKLSTMSGGVNVQGELECDSLDVDGGGDFTGGVSFRGGAGGVDVRAGSDIRLENGGWTGDSAGKIQHHGNWLYLQGGTSGIIFRKSNGDNVSRIDSNGALRPDTNNAYDLGTSSNRWRNLYTNDLNLSNEGSTNDVDGTWGNWTIQEGEDDLFLLNRRNGKKYKFNLTEVN